MSLNRRKSHAITEKLGFNKLWVHMPWSSLSQSSNCTSSLSNENLRGYSSELIYIYNYQRDTSQHLTRARAIGLLNQPKRPHIWFFSTRLSAHALWLQICQRRISDQNWWDYRRIAGHHNIRQWYSWFWQDAREARRKFMRFREKGITFNSQNSLLGLPKFHISDIHCPQTFFSCIPANRRYSRYRAPSQSQWAWESSRNNQLSSEYSLRIY